MKKRQKPIKRPKPKAVSAKGRKAFTLPVRQSMLCPIEFLSLDSNNPRLQTGAEYDVRTETEIIRALSEIAALDELILSISTNQYLNLEPLIVINEPSGKRFRVLEGNRRLAAIKLIRSRPLAEELGVRLPPKISKEVLDSTDRVLVYRVQQEDEAKAFIGFKHINGPQRWDAYAKARYVTTWYKNAKGRLSIDDIAAQLGDNNQTLRDYLNSILVLEQAESESLWKITDRSSVGRFAFSHLYTALGRKEYQSFLGLPEGWSNKPKVDPIAKDKLENLKEMLSFVYGSKPSNQPALVRSQNPDLKNLGTVLTHKTALEKIRNGASLEIALDTTKEPSIAFKDACIAANLRLRRAVELMFAYKGGDESVVDLVSEIYEQADTLRTMTERKSKR